MRQGIRHHRRDSRGTDHARTSERKEPDWAYIVSGLGESIRLGAPRPHLARTALTRRAWNVRTLGEDALQQHHQRGQNPGGHLATFPNQGRRLPSQRFMSPTARTDSCGRAKAAQYDDHQYNNL